MKAGLFRARANLAGDPFDGVANGEFRYQHVYFLRKCSHGYWLAGCMGSAGDYIEFQVSGHLGVVEHSVGGDQDLVGLEAFPGVEIPVEAWKVA